MSLYSVHVSTAKSWRGGENQIWLLARGLLARGQKTLIVAPRGAPLLERAAEAGIPARGIDIRGEVNPFSTLELLRVIRRDKPDVLHLHDGHAVLPGRLAAGMGRLKGLKVVAHRRTVFTLRGRWKYNSGLDRIIAISAAVREKLVAAGVPQERITQVYSGLEFPPHASREEALAFRAKLGLDENDILLAHAAALTGEKRQSDLLHALARINSQLKEAGKRPVHLALAGTGSEEASLRAETTGLGLEIQVHFLGFLRNLGALWASSALAVFCSEAEGLCTALIEAQGAGLCAVVTRAGGMAEVVEDNVTGSIVSIGDRDGIAAAVLKLCNDPALRERMGRAAEERARRLFSADAMVGGVAKVYEELCGRR